MHLDQKLADYARKIGEFFLNKNQGDYEKTHNEIYRLGFTDLKFGQDGKLVIEVKSVGRLIGLKGTQVEELKKFLGIEISVQEFQGAAVQDFILPLPEDEIEDDDLLDQLEAEWDEELAQRTDISDETLPDHFDVSDETFDNERFSYYYD